MIRGRKSESVTLSQDASAPPANLVEARPNVGDETPEIPPSLHRQFEAFTFLGRGGMGVVYRARDFRLGRDVAIKLLLGADPVHSGGFLREAQAQAQIKHDNVCEVYEAGTADYVRYIVMQLIHGDPLDKLAANLRLEEKVRIVRQIASALHEAHRLGMVHRDVKPANIMVERGEDGQWKPYIMDFGLARQMGDSGATMTGALTGTPAFMAPEQAMGKVRSLDRRTDVYALGATLYAILAGAPPFVGEDLFGLLEQVRHAEPKPLGQIDPNIPRDLDAVVMKCIEKEPAARYDSARAFGEDLDRFLNGDAVMARQATLGYRLWKRAKKHKAKVALVAAAIVALGTMGGLWVWGRWRAEMQSRLARELGESAKEMELLLRVAHGMPLHDIERERAVIRGRLPEIEAVMVKAGKIGVGPGHHALARGYLALGEPRVALDHLRAAEKAEYTSPDFEYTTGIALSELYKQELIRARRLPDGPQQKARIVAIETEYRDPALARLKASRNGPVASRAYAEGLIAHYEERQEDARKHAQAAFAESPWLYEAKLLEGDVLFAIGSRNRHDKSFDYAKMKKSFDGAAAAYRDAAEQARSDPAVYAGECGLWIQMMNADSEHNGNSLRSSFDRAREACNQFVAADSQSAEAYVQLAWVHSTFAWWVAAGMQKGEDPDSPINEAISKAGEAMKRSPDDPLAHYVEGAAWRAGLLNARKRGGDTHETAQRAIAGYQGALRLDPDHLWSLNELCWVLTTRGKDEQLHGRDPSASFTQAVQQCERAIALDPIFVPPRKTLILVSRHEADYLAETGRSPETAIARGLAAIDAMVKQDPAWLLGILLRARLLRVSVAYALAMGGDPMEPLAKAEAAVRELEPRTTEFPSAYEIIGLIAMARAEVELAAGRAPETSLQKARECLGKMVALTPWDVDERIWLAEVELLAFHSTQKAGRAMPEYLDAATITLSPLLDAPREDPKFYTVFAEIHEARAALPAEHNKDASAEIERGLARIGEALVKNPHYGPALLVQGKLWLLRADLARDAEAKREAAARAVHAFGAAFRANSLLERTENTALEKATRLAEGGSASQ